MSPPASTSNNQMFLKILSSRLFWWTNNLLQDEIFVQWCKLLTSVTKHEVIRKGVSKLCFNSCEDQVFEIICLKPFVWPRKFGIAIIFRYNISKNSFLSVYSILDAKNYNNCMIYFSLDHPHMLVTTHIYCSTWHPLA